MQPDFKDPLLMNNDGDAFQLQTRLSATQEAIKRTRLALFFCLVASLSSLVCLWNTILSVDRLNAFRATDPKIRQYLHHDNTFAPEDGERRNEISKDLIANWMESTYIDSSLLGLKVSVSDFSFYNSTVMLLLSLYLLLAARRENREVGRLLQSVIKGEFSLGHNQYLPYTVYRSVMSYMVFNLSRNADARIWSIYDDVQVPNTPPAGRTTRVPFSVFLLHLSVLGMFMMPWLSITVNTLYHIFVIKFSDFPWGDRALGFLAWPVLIWEVLCLVFVGYLTITTREFAEHTRHLVDQFKLYSECIASGLPKPKPDTDPPPRLLRVLALPLPDMNVFRRKRK